MRRFKFAILPVLLILLTSCSNNERLVKKFIVRLNAREATKASKYIYPEDEAKLYVFSKLFLEQNDVMSLDIVELNQGKDELGEFVDIKLTCNNCDDNIYQYFKHIGVLYGDTIIDRFRIRTLHDSKVINFSWKWNTDKLPQVLMNAKITSDVLNVRKGPGTNYGIITKLKSGNKIVIDKATTNSSWLKCFLFDKNGEITRGYIASEFATIEDISFFKIGMFGKIGLLLGAIIGVVVVIVIIPLMLTTIFRTAEDNWEIAIVLFLLLAGIVALAYSIIESVLFELFLINLPL